MSSVTIEEPELADAEAMARVHVQAWQETYRGLMPDSVLDDVDAVAHRTRFWSAVLGDSHFADFIPAVAKGGEDVVGIAMAQPSRDGQPQQLHVLYVLKSHHGSGAGTALLARVLRLDEPAELWVADPNPRAQAFYREHGFLDDGVSKVEGAVREAHMARPAR